MSWMKELAAHYEATRRRYPDDNLLIVFDIDNTIIDMREMIVYVLRSYDREHGTRHFAGLKPTSLSINENQVGELLEGMDIAASEQKAILEWYFEKRWDSAAILSSHRPFAGVMEVLRWFQMQPRTDVALNTGRPEVLRADTLRSLNALGEAYKVSFDDDLLYMNPGTWSDVVTGSKAEGIRRFREMGYRVFAMVDNEPDNLEAIARAFEDESILLLHADTIFDSSRARLPEHSVSGSDYDLTDLIPERALPDHIRFVWHGVNDEANLRQFVASDVQWAECDARLDRGSGAVVLRHDSFIERRLAPGEALLRLDEVVPKVLGAGKSLKIDIKERGRLVDRLVMLLERLDVPATRLWFNGNVLELGEAVFAHLAARFPGSTIQCSIDHLAALIVVSPSVVKEKLDALRATGINRFSIAWGEAELGVVMNRLDEWGHDVNIYNVPDLESFLRAVLLHPTSVTSDFNFPEWHHYGRGPGAGARHHSYTLAG